MAKIKLYCHYQALLGWKVELLFFLLINNKNYDFLSPTYFFSRAETEKGLSRKHIIEGVKGSLERLQLDYVDIVYANKPDAHTPMEGI